MSRVTPSEVKDLISTPVGDPIVQVWIDAAHTIVDSKADCITSDQAVLTQIELYLSAHYIALLDPKLSGRITHERIDVFSTTFSERGLSEELMNRTSFGMTANMLSGGCLIATTKAKATVYFL